MEARIGWEVLQDFVGRVFVAAGVPEDDARIEAEVLVWANLRGVDSHGVLRIPIYIKHLASGGMNPRPTIVVEKETPAVLLIEADHALGPVVTVAAMRRAMAKASQVGIGWAVIRNTTHQGAIGYYAQMAAREGMAGMALVCSPPNMAPYGARAAGVHNSPLAIAVPAERHPPLVLDLATSVAAAGKLSLAIDKGVRIPEGWALDKDGRPTTDPRAAATLLPAGGYKGSGLAMMFECLASVMTGNSLVAPVLRGERPKASTQNSVVAAVDIATFTGVDDYRRQVDALIEGIKSLPTAEGCDEVLVPGEPEDREAAVRRREGIPLPPGTARNLRDVAAQLGVDCPPEIALAAGGTG